MRSPSGGAVSNSLLPVGPLKHGEYRISALVRGVPAKALVTLFHKTTEIERVRAEGRRGRRQKEINKTDGQKKPKGLEDEP